MNLKENNELIAKFMGYTFTPVSSHPSVFPNGTWDKNGIGHCAKKGLSFNSDWNWIMNVVLEIEKINLQDVSFTFEIGHSQIQIYGYGNSLEFGSAIIILQDVGSSKIEAVYNACVKFINWYNENLAKETNVIVFDVPIVIQADPVEVMQAISIKGEEVTVEYIEYGNLYKTETKNIKYLPDSVHEKIKNLCNQQKK